MAPNAVALAAALAYGLGPWDLAQEPRPRLPGATILITESTRALVSGEPERRPAREAAPKGEPAAAA